MKKISTRIISLLCILALGMPILAGCSEKLPDKVKLENVFKIEELKIEDNNIQSVYNVTVSGDYMFFIGDVSEDERYYSALFSMKTDGTDLKMLVENKDNSDYEKQIYSSSYINSIVADNDGNVWVSKQEYYSDYSNPDEQINENNYFFVKYDRNGNELLTIDDSQIKKDEEYFYVNAIAVDKMGNLYACSEMSIFVFDSSNGKLLFNVQGTEYFNTMATSGTGDVFVTGWSEGGMHITLIDFNARAFGTSYPVTNNNMYSLFSGYGEYDFLYYDQSSLYGYKLEAGESVELLNWINSDINSGRLNSVSPLKDGRVICSIYDEGYDNPTLNVLTRKSDTENIEVIPLTYACLWMDDTIRSEILKYNRSQDEYKIQIEDYSKYNNYNVENGYKLGQEKLSMDIISGNIPDIINLYELDSDPFISKGLLVDMNKFLDADEEISRDDLLANVLEAGSIDGKLYRLITSFSTSTLIGKTSVVGSKAGWTMEDMLNLIKSNPDSTAFSPEYTKSDILQYFLRVNMSQFIDKSTGRCSFNEADFKLLLEFVNTFPDEIDWDSIYGEDNAWQIIQESYKDGRILLQNCYVSGLRAIKDYKETFGGDITFIGVPTNDGLGSVIQPDAILAISAKSKAQDAAWSFVRRLISDKELGNNYYGYNNYPINKHKLMKMIDYEKTPMGERNNDNSIIGGRVYSSAEIAIATSAPGGYWGGDDDYYNNYHLSDEEANQMLEYITSVNRLVYQNEEVFGIINEEAADYFSGAKSVDAVTEIIQNRVQTYVDESR